MRGAAYPGCSGNLFGTTYYTVFELVPGSNTITTLASVAPNGRPQFRGGVVEDSSGDLFGTTNQGGADGVGTVFELVAGRHTFTTLASFNNTNGANNANSADPRAGLIEDSSGNLFGTTFQGGASGYGTVFEMAAGSSTITTLASFNNTNGAHPSGTLVEDSSGNLFGTTPGGGPNNVSTVYEVVAGSNTITTIASVTDIASNFSSAAGAGLIEDSSGNLFGATAGGGACGNGAVFEVAAGSNTVTTLASFTSTGGGFLSAGPLIEDGNGNFFGTTSGGGTSGLGTVFEVAAGSNTITTLASFNGMNGAEPQAGVIEDSSGNLFGTTLLGGSGGGLVGAGTVFEVAAGSNTVTTLASFDAHGTKGVNPLGGLIEDSSGNLFGTTYAGGANGVGTVFEVAAGSNTITTLASFNNTNGAQPRDGVVEDSSGDLFGTTSQGGADGVGAVFEVVAGSNTITTLASFNNTNGANPSGGLIEDSNGNLFGTAGGGTSGFGTVFEVLAGSNTITTVASFSANLGSPAPGLVEDSSGNLFGTTYQGGTNDGSVFEVAAGSNTITALAFFNKNNTNNLVYPIAGLIDIRGNLFGITDRGGASASGTVFELPALQVQLVAATPAIPDPNNPDALLTNASSVSYTVTFTKPVTGVDPSEFVLATTGTITATLPQVQPIAGSYGAAYSVTVSGITGDGTLGLNLMDNGGIRDLAGEPLAPGIGDAVGQIYTIDHAAPVVQSYVGATPGSPDPYNAGAVLTSASSVSYTLTFNEQVTGVDPSEFVLATSGTISAGSVQVQPIDGSNGTAYTLTVSGITGGGTLGLNLRGNGGIRDLAGNELPQGSGDAVGQVYTIDTNPPVVQSFVGATPANPDPNNPEALLTNATSVSYTLTFNEQVTGVNAADFGVSAGFGSLAIQVTPVAGSNGTAYTITVNGVTGSGEFSVFFNTLTSITDQSGFAFNLTAAPAVASFPSGQTYTIDQVPPVVLAITPTTPAGPARLSTSASSVSYTITFSKPVTGVDGTDFTLTETGTVAATSTQATADPNNPNNWIVTISGITGNGTLGLKLANNNHIVDLAGNALSPAVTPVTLQSLPTITLPAGESLMAVADINGDGKADLIIANSYTNSMSVMLDNCNGTFQSEQPFAVGVAPFSGVVADVNGDGKPDLVVINPGTDSVSVMLNNGDGTFQSPQAYLSSDDGTVAVAVTVADINGDGKPDLVVANSGGNYSNGNVSVLLNNGNGTFQAPETLVNGSPFVNPFDPNSLVVGDVNGDGKPDIVVGTAFVSQYYNSIPGQVILLQNDGAGNFPNSQLVGGLAGGSIDVALADLNGDGKADIVADNGSGVTVALNNGDGTFTNDLSVPNVPSVPFGADLTGDGKVDDLVVGGNPGDNTVSVFLHVPPVYTIGTPTAHIAADPNATQAADKANLILTATDPLGSQESAAGFTYSINWGDGTNPRTVSATANNGSGAPVCHTYAADGSYLVSITATNKDGAVSSTATGLIVVSSQASDSIALSGGASAGQVAVSVDGASAGTFSPTDLVLVSGQGGNDTFTVNFGSTLTTPIALAGSNSAGDTLTVNGDNSLTNVITKTPGQITWGSPVTETVSRSGIPNTVVSANGTSQNYINDPGGSTTINGGPGANTITVTATTGSGVVINGGAGANTYIVDLGSLAGPVTIQNNHSTATNNLIVNGAAGNNTIAASGNQVTSGVQTITDTASLINLTVNGGSGNNQVTVSSFTVPVQNLALNGGGGSNTFTLNNVGSTVGALAITGGSGGPGSSQVQVQGSLPAQVTVPANTAPVVNLGTSAAVNVFNAFTRSAAFVATGSAFTATVDYGDGSGAHSLALNADKSFSLNHVYASVGSYTVTVRVVDSQGDIGTGTMTVAVTLVSKSIYVVNAQATSGALTIAGNASINLPGTLVVDSTSSSAILASGNAKITAAGGVLVSGCVSKSGNASVTKTGTPGATGDPLASLLAPTPPTYLGTPIVETLSGNSTATISQGLYSQITVSGNAKLTLNPGFYVIGTGGVSISGNATLSGSGVTYIVKGGGFTVSGNAGISGSNVLIVNAGSNYPNPPISGETFGGVTLSGNGSFSLSAATTGSYAGILIYQARDNTRALSVSGNSMAGITGTIYAANALLTMSGNASLQNPLVVGTLNLSGNVALTQLAHGSDGAGDSAGIGNTLLAGNLDVYINDPSGYFTPDMLARIQDAIDGINALLLPYNVTITEVGDPSLANVILDDATTSASGTMADGVLGCYNPTGSQIEITMIRGWNWYAGANPTQIGQDQYDFQTTVTHELGHSLGLGGSASLTSPMNETLPTGTARRTMAAADLNIPEPPDGADPLTAAQRTSTRVEAGPVNLLANPGRFSVTLAPTTNPAPLYAAPYFIAPVQRSVDSITSGILASAVTPVRAAESEPWLGLDDVWAPFADQPAPAIPALNQTSPETILLIFENPVDIFRTEPTDGDQEMSTQQVPTESTAVLDQVFAQMAADMDDFSDLSD